MKKNTRQPKRAVAVGSTRLVRQLRERAAKGFATCRSGDGNPKIVIEFRDLRECQECYETLVKLWAGDYTLPNDQAHT